MVFDAALDLADMYSLDLMGSKIIHKLKLKIHKMKHEAVHMLAPLLLLILFDSGEKEGRFVFFFVFDFLGVRVDCGLWLLD